MDNMTKNELKHLLFELLKDRTTQFSDVTADDALDALIIKPVNGKPLIINVDSYNEGEKYIRLWAKEKPVSLSISLALMQMIDLGILTEEEALKYQEQALEIASDTPAASAELYDHYGDILFALDRVSDALEAWQQAIRIHQENGDPETEINPIEIKIKERQQ